MRATPKITPTQSPTILLQDSIEFPGATSLPPTAKCSKSRFAETLLRNKVSNNKISENLVKTHNGGQKKIESVIVVRASTEDTRSVVGVFLGGGTAP